MLPCVTEVWKFVVIVVGTEVKTGSPVASEIGGGWYFKDLVGVGCRAGGVIIMGQGWGVLVLCCVVIFIVVVV